MSASEARQRTRLVGVRLTPAEYEYLLELANEAGLSIAALLRRRALSTPTHNRAVGRSAEVFVWHNRDGIRRVERAS